MLSSRPSLRRPLALTLLIFAACCAASWPTIGSGASSGTVVSAVVPSAISMQDSCTQSAGHSFGTVLPGSPVTTATGSAICRFSFTSSNSSSMLRLYQSDRTTQAMVGTTPSWNWHGIGGSDKDVDRSGTSLMVLQDSWAANGHYDRSIDGGATWTSFFPGGGTTQNMAVASSTVAWRFADGIALVSTDMQNPTPTWTPAGTTLANSDPFLVLDADAVSATTAWVSHYDGIYRTANAGATAWSVSSSPCPNPFVIEATTAANAFVIGWGQICRSDNSNSSWTSTNVGLPADFGASDIKGSPVTAAVIWTVGSNGRVARSTNNGDSWTLTTPIPVPVDLTTLDVISDSEAVVAGLSGMAYRTTTSGATWSRVRLGAVGSIRGILAPTASVVIAANSYGGSIATSDGGTTWAPPSGFSDAYRDIDSVDRQNLVMALGRGRIARSTDSGATRTHVLAGVGVTNFRGVAMLDSDSWIAVGESGTIAITEDAGVSWSTRPSGTSEDLWDVDVTSEHVAIAVGASGTILRSTDGGWNWTTRSAAGGHLTRVEIDSGAPGIAVGFGGTIRRSTDNGLTWTTPASGTTTNLDSLSLVSDDTAYASSPGLLLKTVDGGATWRSRSVGGMSRMDAVSEEVVWMTTAYVGGWDEWANISHDGGVTWTAPFGNNNPDVTALHAIDSGTVFFGGNGEALRRTNSAPTIPDYSAGSWTAATTQFGACLQDLSGSAAVAAWTEDVSGTCTASDGDNWYAVPTAPVKVAQMAAAGTGTVDLVWGFRPAANLPRGSFVAAITVEAIAPNA